MKRGSSTRNGSDIPSSTRSPLPGCSLVSTRPNNRSKYTSKCTKPRCTERRIHPASKSEDKTKVNQKIKSGDVVSRDQSQVGHMACRGRTTRFEFFGLFATGILDNLSSDYTDYTHDGEDQNNESDDIDENGSVGSEEVMGLCNVDDVLDYQIEADECWCLVPQT